MGRPQGDGTWATSSTFVSGGDSWDGDPTKVEPSAGRKAEGWEPTQVPPAEFFNFWMNRIYLLSDYIVNVQAMDFRPWGTHPSGITTVFFIGAAAVAGSSSRWYSGETAAGQRVRFSDDWGRSWTVATVDVPAGETFVRFDESAGEVLVITSTGGAASRIFRSVNSGANWVETTPAWGGATTTPNDLWFDGSIGGGSGTWLVSTDSTVIRRSTDGGVTWVTLTTPPTRGDIFAGDKAKIILAGGGTAGVFAAEDGDNFSSVLTDFSGGGVGSMHWASGIGLFVVTGTDGGGATNVWTSPDGNAWTRHDDSFIAGLSGVIREVVDDGGDLLIGRVDDSGIGANDRTIFSIDRGITWRDGLPPNAGNGFSFFQSADRRGNDGGRFWANLGVVGGTLEFYGSIGVA